jgi:hypothetical protein
MAEVQSEVTAPEVPEGVLAAEADVTTDVVDPLGEQAAAEPEDANPLEWLPEDLREHERFKDIKTPEALAKAYAEAKLAQELPETYQVPEGVPEQVGKWAKETGLTQAQLDAMLALNGKMAEYSNTVRTNVYAQGRQALFDSWGEKKAENLKIAENALAAIPSGQKLAHFIKTSGEGANPVVIQALHEFGTFLQEGGFLKNPNVATKAKGDPLKARYPTMFKTESEE